MSDITQDLIDQLLTPVDVSEERERQSRKRRPFRDLRDQLESYFPHSFLDPMVREFLWGIVATGLELAAAHANGGPAALEKQIAETTFDERFEPYLQEGPLMLEWARGIVRDGYQESFARVVQESVATTEPALRVLRAVAGLVTMGVALKMRAPEIVEELAPVFREKESVFPARAAKEIVITDEDLPDDGSLCYAPDAVGYRVGEFGTREFQQSERNPNRFYHVDEFMALMEIDTSAGRTRVLAQPFGAATRERRRRLRARGLKVNARSPMEHPFYYNESDALLYAAVHCRAFTVWDTEQKRRLYHAMLPDEAVLLHALPDGRVRVAVRETGLFEYNGSELVRVRSDTGMPERPRFLAIAPARWGDATVYGLANALLVVRDETGDASVLTLPGPQNDKIASFSVAQDEIIVTTWERYLHIFRGTGYPGENWSAESRRTNEFHCVAPDGRWGVLFDRHDPQSTAWAAPWSFAIVEDVPGCPESTPRPHVIRMDNLVQIIPTLHPGGRLTIWQEGNASASVSYGTRDGIRGEFGVQQLPPAYQDAITSSDGTLVARRTLLSPAEIAISDASGRILSRTTFPRVDRLMSIDPERETLTLRGRAGLELAQTVAEHDARPKLSRWTWHWPSDTWTQSDATFHGQRFGGTAIRELVTMLMNGGHDLVFRGTAGMRCHTIEKPVGEELIIVNDAVFRVDLASGEQRVHPLRPLLYGWRLEDIRIEIDAEADRAWISEPGGVVGGYSLHDAKRLWRIRLPNLVSGVQALEVRYQAIGDQRPVLVLWNQDRQVFVVDSDTGALEVAITMKTELFCNTMRPIVTKGGVLVSIDDVLVLVKRAT